MQAFVEDTERKEVGMAMSAGVGGPFEGPHQLCQVMDHG